VHLKTHGSLCVFLKGIERMYLPVAHAEGKFVARDDGVLNELDTAGQLALRYVSADATTDPAGKDDARVLPFPENPNGAQANVAGACDSTGRVLGLMPHPERHLEPIQHPRWTRGEAGEVGDGFQIFVNAVRYFGD
jgi:phosphoribosylformylglycinamidine synthase